MRKGNVVEQARASRLHREQNVAHEALGIVRVVAVGSSPQPPLTVAAFECPRRQNRCQQTVGEGLRVLRGHWKAQACARELFDGIPDDLHRRSKVRQLVVESLRPAKPEGNLLGSLRVFGRSGIRREGVAAPLRFTGMRALCGAMSPRRPACTTRPVWASPNVLPFIRWNISGQAWPLLKRIIAQMSCTNPSAVRAVDAKRRAHSRTTGGHLIKCATKAQTTRTDTGSPG